MFSSSTSSPSPTNALAHIRKQVDDQINNNDVVIYSKLNCSYSDRTKALFKKRFPDIHTHVVDIDTFDDGPLIQKYLHELTNQRTVPNVFIGGHHIGGNDEIQKRDRSGNLQLLINSLERRDDNGQRTTPDSQRIN